MLRVLLITNYVLFYWSKFFNVTFNRYFYLSKGSEYCFHYCMSVAIWICLFHLHLISSASVQPMKSRKAGPPEAEIQTGDVAEGVTTSPNWVTVTSHWCHTLVSHTLQVFVWQIRTEGGNPPAPPFLQQDHFDRVKFFQRRHFVLSFSFEASLCVSSLVQPSVLAQSLLVLSI